jgi:tetratricopeptide (TPR) repeat protein
LFQGLKASFDRWLTFRQLRAVAKRDNYDRWMEFKEQIDLAKTSFDRGVTGQALQIWNRMHVQFPALFVVSEDALNLTIDLGRYDDVERLMLDGCKLYPDRAAFAAVSCARADHLRGDQSKALYRCEILREKFPARSEGYSIAASCLSALGRFSEAEAMTERGVVRFPDDLELRVQFARYAARRCDWPSALERWQTVRYRFDHPVGYQGVGRSLGELGRFIEAEKIVSEACERWESKPFTWAEFANLATIRGDFEEAVHRWASTRRRFPFFVPGYDQGAEAMRRAGLDADEVLRTGITLIPTEVNLYLLYARNAQHREDWMEAAARWNLLLERFPTCDEARKQKALAIGKCEISNLD